MSSRSVEWGWRWFDAQSDIRLSQRMHRREFMQIWSEGVKAEETASVNAWTLEPENSISWALGSLE